jgi:hypothetical protein
MHLGGSPETDDVAVFNRLTGATIAAHLTLVKPGDVVIGASASHSHPDRFGNQHAPQLSYARGKIIRSTEDDLQKLLRAWVLIRERGQDKIYVFTGLEHSLPLAAEELTFADDEIAPALCFERLRKLALEHHARA